MKIERYLNCKFYRINPDAENFDIFFEISKIQNYITKSNEEKVKSKFARELLTLAWVGFWGLFWGGDGGKITTCLKLVRITLETWNLACKYTPICSFRKYNF